jgi:hypothetical protein
LCNTYKSSRYFFRLTTSCCENSKSIVWKGLRIQGSKRPKSGSTSAINEGTVLFLHTLNTIVSPFINTRLIFILSPSNAIWRALAFSRWPNFSEYNNIKDWYALYRRRYHRVPKYVATSHDSLDSVLYVATQHSIDVCPKMEVNCPQIWEDLEETSYFNKRYCRTCKRHVHHVETQEALVALAKQGECVSFFARDMYGKRSVGCALF